MPLGHGGQPEFNRPVNMRGPDPAQWQQLDPQMAQAERWLRTIDPQQSTYFRFGPEHLRRFFGQAQAVRTIRNGIEKDITVELALPAQDHRATRIDQLDSNSAARFTISTQQRALDLAGRGKRKRDFGDDTRPRDHDHAPPFRLKQRIGQSAIVNRDQHGDVRQ